MQWYCWGADPHPAEKFEWCPEGRVAYRAGIDFDFGFDFGTSIQKLIGLIGLIGNDCLEATRKGVPLFGRALGKGGGWRALIAGGWIFPIRGHSASREPWRFRVRGWVSGS